VPPAAGAGEDRVTKWIPLVGIAGGLLILLDAPGRAELVTFPTMLLILATLLRPGVAATLAMGTAVLVGAMVAALASAPLLDEVEPATQFVADQLVVCAFGGLSLFGAWLASRARPRARDGLRLVVGMLAAALAFDLFLSARLAARGFELWWAVRAPAVAGSAAALVAVFVWRARPGLRHG
jgi:hypothetical protein